MIKKVAVVGGGVSGLTSAFYLKQKYPKIHVDLFDQ